MARKFSPTRPTRPAVRSVRFARRSGEAGIFHGTSTLDDVVTLSKREKKDEKKGETGRRNRNVCGPAARTISRIFQQTSPRILALLLLLFLFLRSFSSSCSGNPGHHPFDSACCGARAFYHFDRISFIYFLSFRSLVHFVEDDAGTCNDDAFVESLIVYRN